MPKYDYELPLEPTDADWTEAERRKSLRVLVVEGEYEIRDGLLRVTERGRDRVVREYFPIASRGVLGEFSRLTIGDETALCSFANRWGLLGFNGLDSLAPTLPLGGDSVAWVWAHLAGIQTVIGLHRLSRKRDVDGASQFVQGLSISKPARLGLRNINTLIERGEFLEAQNAFVPADAGGERAWPGPSVIYGDRGRVALSLYARPRSGDEPLATAWQIMSDVMNPNVRGVYPQMDRWVERLEAASPVIQGWDSLLSVIYRHLFDVVVGGNVQECRECGTPFVQTDGRQRFCPPSFTRESPCAMRFHKREQRKRPPKVGHAQ